MTEPNRSAPAGNRSTRIEADRQPVDPWLGTFADGLEPWQRDVARQLATSDPHELPVILGGRRGAGVAQRELVLAYWDTRRKARRRLRRRLIVRGIVRHPVARVTGTIGVVLVTVAFMLVVQQGASA